MNNCIKDRLQQISLEKRMGIMTHVVIGYPSLAETISLVELMEQAGVDFVELQIPFSDPLADGPTIMKACEKSLSRGTTVGDAFKISKTVSEKVSIPLIIMAYYNTIFSYGIEKFCSDAKAAGVAGMIVPDMPLDEEKYEQFYYHLEQTDVYPIMVISPTTPNERLTQIAKLAKGFIYCTSRQGITGIRSELDKDLIDSLGHIKDMVHLPIAVGFGISQKNHMQVLTEFADIVVIGSAVINIISKNEKDYRRDVLQFLKNMLE